MQSLAQTIKLAALQLLYDYENYNQLEFVNFLLYFFLQNIKIKQVLLQPGAILVQTTREIIGKTLEDSRNLNL